MIHSVKPNILMVYLVAGLSCLLLTTTFYLGGFKPLADRLRSGHEAEIEFSMRASQWLVQGVLDRHFALARQTASRTAIRQRQVEHLQGRISLETLRGFSNPKLADALIANDELLGIERLGPSGERFLQVGLLPNESPAEACLAREDSGIHLLEPMPLGEYQALVYCSPIIDPAAGWVGSDLLYVNASALNAVIERPQERDLRTMTFGLAGPTGDILFWPRTQAPMDSLEAFERFRRGQEQTSGHLVRVLDLEGTNWQLFAVVNEQRFFAETNEQLGRLTLILGLLVLVIFVLTVATLRPIIRTLVEAHDLADRAQRDGMTGLFNHAHMQELVEREIQRSRRYRNAFSLLMLDIDHFKQVNDTHGHPVGDEVLSHIAQILTDLARQPDLAARYGGEEFLLVMPETGPEGALMVAERLRQEIKDNPVEVGGTHIPITVSIGVASCPAHTPPPSRQSMIRIADEALYASKRNGRDRVTQQVIDGKTSRSLRRVEGPHPDGRKKEGS
ncbi:GGDEF domain-containing protein [Ectothiorhodospira haloalkaliphila]|uniref:GGDEF domain-containing protein n=1 Tax=Ectothiorhodospira haloalkaliphila TaxID=421628 RepID=UPI001EE7BCEE|nr:GGDEF domain-containing protein [Ectothiorhodospira haloalkaliphila]